MAGKFIRNFLNKGKKSDKENLQGDEEDFNGNFGSKRVNFGEKNPLRSSLKNGRKNRSYSYTAEDYDEDDSSEATLKLPLPNPYNVVTEPKKTRATRSLAAGNIRDDDRNHHENSFRSEFFHPDEPMAFDNGRSRQHQQRHRRTFDDGRFKLLSTHGNSIDLDALREVGNHGINEVNPRSMKSIRDGRFRHHNDSTRVLQLEERCHYLEKQYHYMQKQLERMDEKEREERGRRKHLQKELSNEVKQHQKVVQTLTRQIDEYQEKLNILHNHMISQQPAATELFHRKLHTIGHQSNNTQAMNLNPVGPDVFGQNSHHRQWWPRSAGEVVGLSQIYQHQQQQNFLSGQTAPPTSIATSLEDNADKTVENGLRVNTQQDLSHFQNILVDENCRDEVKIHRKTDTSTFSNSPRSDTLEEIDKLKAEMETDFQLSGDNSSRSFELSSSLDMEMSRNGRLPTSASCAEISLLAGDKYSSVLRPDSSVVDDTLTFQSSKDDGYATSDTTRAATTSAGEPQLSNQKTRMRNQIVMVHGEEQSIFRRSFS